MADIDIDIIQAQIKSSIAVKEKIHQDHALLSKIADAAIRIGETLKRGGVIYSCGNGGSACDAQHFTEELVARYKKNRQGLKAMHLMDPAVLTCWSNDYNYETAFERQVQTFCTPNDLLVLFSTSGNSPNVIAAARKAKELGCPTICLTGETGGELKKDSSILINVPHIGTSERIQESHIMIVHIICEYLDAVFD